MGSSGHGRAGQTTWYRESVTAKDILEAALSLPPEERSQLIEELSASLPSDFAEDAIEKAWLDEIDRRSGEIDAGTAELLEWSDVRARIAERRAG